MLSQLSIVAILAACAFAQNSDNGTISTANYFNISSVPLSTRSSWCISQTSVCSTLCGGDASQNTCDNVDLNISCTCASNNSAPGLPFYLNTVPTNECQSAFKSCIEDHPNDQTGQNACTTDIEDTCGTIDSTNMTFGTTTTSASASATAAPTASGTASSVDASSTPSATANSAAAAAAIGAGEQYGLGALAAGAIAAFGFML